MTPLLTCLGSLKNGAKCTFVDVYTMPRDSPESMGLLQDNANLGVGGV